MNAVLADLLKVLELERLETNLFRGESRDIGSPQVFGGQVLGQALMAAFSTVEGRTVHSLHAYFLRAGDFNARIVYEVDRSRDGGSFTSRRVVAIQHGKQIFHMSASFQAEEHGLEHQIAMPDVVPPEELPVARGFRKSEVPRSEARSISEGRPFEFRLSPVETWTGPGLRYLWFKTVDKVPPDDALSRCLLAYVSDHYLLAAPVSRHGLRIPNPDLQVASLDHAMWFHRPAAPDDWLLYVIDSPSASGARGLSIGNIFSRDGRLVATTVQEGLVRFRAQKSAG